MKSLRSLFKNKRGSSNFSQRLSAYVDSLSLGYLEYFEDWIESDFKSPAPIHIKWTVLNRWKSGEHWVETGTLWGETTEYLSKQGFKVITIEPSKELAELASKKFDLNKNVKVWNDLSENCLHSAIAAHLEEEARGISFWLDGHYSGEGTHKGPVETPILGELTTISKFIQKFSTVSVFVDDIRLFNDANIKHKDYPRLDSLVAWANENSLSWTIEQDIFIATNNENAISNYVNK